ncbi:MAG: site-specific integrase, partial [bacterium]|nr:site-specific integrase [bacterium]
GRLDDYLKERKQVNCLSPFLFVSSTRDDRLTEHGFKHVIDTLNDRAEVKFHPHQLRHTFAVNVLSVNHDLAALQQLMGHTDIRMTAVYLRNLPSKVLRSQVANISLDNLV